MHLRYQVRDPNGVVLDQVYSQLHKKKSKQNTATLKIAGSAKSSAVKLFSHSDTLTRLSEHALVLVSFVAADPIPTENHHVSTDETIEIVETTPIKCMLPIVSGNCMAYIPMYAFNPERSKCEPFVYGGCGGNENQFDTLEECVDLCEK
ncbi:hypothetical protein AHF37_01538 [Paragonimus kellicotti]|nr:hypothetical protein AHF37_01538 [Paragonimus kellicotti]